MPVIHSPVEGPPPENWGVGGISLDRILGK